MINNTKGVPHGAAVQPNFVRREVLPMNETIIIMFMILLVVILRLTRNNRPRK